MLIDIISLYVYVHIYIYIYELPWSSGYELQLSLERLRVPIPVKVIGERQEGHPVGPKMLTAPAKSQLTIGHRLGPVKTGSVWHKTTSLSSSSSYICRIYSIIICYLKHCSRTMRLYEVYQKSSRTECAVWAMCGVEINGCVNVWHNIQWAYNCNFSGRM